jgi:hypothetical protein
MSPRASRRPGGAAGVEVVRCRRRAATASTLVAWVRELIVRAE